MIILKIATIGILVALLSTGLGSDLALAVIAIIQRAGPLRVCAPLATAEEIGADEKTVRKARASHDAPEEENERIGRDGKLYPAKPRLMESDVDEFDEGLAFSQTKDAFIARRRGEQFSPERRP